MARTKLTASSVARTRASSAPVFPSMNTTFWYAYGTATISPRAAGAPIDPEASSRHSSLQVSGSTATSAVTRVCPVSVCTA